MVLEYMRCNGCGQEMERKSQCIATSCSHLFCTTCAQSIIEKDEPCPICDSIITKSNVKLVTIMQRSGCQMALVGQEPQAVMEAALHAIRFYSEQQQLASQYEANLLNSRFAKMQRQCKTKLEQVHAGYLQAKRKYQEMAQAKATVAQDNAELQSKYTQKAMQARKLQEMLKAMQAEADELRRRLHGSSGGGGIGGAGRCAGGMGALGSGHHGGAGLHLTGGGSGRGGQQSPFGAMPGQTITTVHQQRAVIELSPTPGAFLGHGNGSQHRVMAGSGASTFSMFGGGGSPGGLGGGGGGGGGTALRRPGTAPGAGMFASGAGSGARGVARLPGGGGLRMGGGLGGGQASSPAHGMMSM